MLTLRDLPQPTVAVVEGAAQGESDTGVQGAHLNHLGLFLRTSAPCIWRILSTFPPA
jgi:hypothetical protein